MLVDGRDRCAAVASWHGPRCLIHTDQAVSTARHPWYRHSVSDGCRPLLDVFHHAGHCRPLGTWPTADHNSAQPRGRHQFCYPWHGIRCAQAQPHAASETLHMAVKVCAPWRAQRCVSRSLCTSVSFSAACMHEKKTTVPQYTPQGLQLPPPLLPHPHQQPRRPPDSRPLTVQQRMAA